MTPKEKAKQLVGKMQAHQMPSLRVSTMEINLNDTMPNAKQCALITVEQLINEYPSFPRGTWEESRALYWLEVKQELEKL